MKKGLRSRMNCLKLCISFSFDGDIEKIRSKKSNLLMFNRFFSSSKALEWKIGSFDIDKEINKPHKAKVPKLLSYQQVEWS